MFVDVALARELERGEARMCAEIAERVGARCPDRRTLVSPLGGGLACFSGLGSPANKAIGVGFDAPLDPGELDAVEAAWRERGEPMRVELASLALPEAARTLTERGYRLIGFENVLGRSLEVIDAPGTVQGLTLEILPPDELEPWLRVVVDGFAVPDEGPEPFEQHSREVLESVIRDVSQLNGMRRYVARIDGEPAGAASMRIDGRFASLAGAATLPAFRRRGVQSALFERRLADAAADGCTIATVVTQPGSKSQANAQRRGFAVLYTRAILVRDWTPAT